MSKSTCWALRAPIRLILLRSRSLVRSLVSFDTNRDSHLQMMQLLRPGRSATIAAARVGSRSTTNGGSYEEKSESKNLTSLPFLIAFVASLPAFFGFFNLLLGFFRERLRHSPPRALLMAIPIIVIAIIIVEFSASEFHSIDARRDLHTACLSHSNAVAESRVKYEIKLVLIGN